MMDKPETKTCEFCGEQVLKVAIKCKHCHSSIPDQPSLASEAKDLLAGGKRPFNKIKKRYLLLVLILSALVIILAPIAIYENAPYPLWAKIIAPFDTRPEATISSLLTDSRKMRQHNIELCEWHQREYLREKTLYNKKMKDVICSK